MKNMYKLQVATCTSWLYKLEKWQFLPNAHNKKLHLDSFTFSDLHIGVFHKGKECHFY